MHGRKFHRFFHLLILLSALGVSALAQPDSLAPRPFVAIISWDGAKARVVKHMTEQGTLPTLSRLLPNGAYTFQAHTIVPSKTLPSHTSMLTGVSPSVHGILWNRYEPEKEPVKVPTVFELAKQHGYRTAMIFAKSKFQHLVRPGTVDTAVYVRGNALEVMKTAIQVLRVRRPHLVFIHLPDPDRTGHQYGWGNDQKGIPPSKEYLKALQRCDQALGFLVDSLKAWGWWDDAVLIITADHGGYDRTHGSADPEDVEIPWIAVGGRVPSKGALRATVKTMDTAATALKALGVPIPKSWEGRPVLSSRSLLQPKKAAP